MTNLQDFQGKIKGLLADDAIFTSALIILVGIASFGLGRHSSSLERVIPGAGGQASAIEPLTGQKTEATVTETTENVIYVASKNSTKYHLPWCSGAKNISEANKITFASKEEAKAAGYTPAANCPGI